MFSLGFLFQRLWAQGVGWLERLGFPGAAHYLSGASSLPPPLTPEEEKDLLQRLAAGDAAARDLLITRNLRLVVYLARKYDSSAVPQEDLISIGTIGLIKAVNTFTRRQETSLEEPLNVDGEGNELLLSDILGSEEDTVSQHLEQDAERAVLRRAVERLSPREKQIMELRFGLGNGVEHTQKQTADVLGISQSYISRLEKRIIRLLRVQLEGQ